MLEISGFSVTSSRVRTIKVDPPSAKDRLLSFVVVPLRGGIQNRENSKVERIGYSVEGDVWKEEEEEGKEEEGEGEKSLVAFMDDPLVRI